MLEWSLAGASGLGLSRACELGSDAPRHPNVSGVADLAPTIDCVDRR